MRKAQAEIDQLGRGWRIKLDGMSVPVGTVPCYDALELAWVNAKGYRMQFGWADFPAFVEEILSKLPPPPSAIELELLDAHGPFVLSNLAWWERGAPKRKLGGQRR